jgi:hypothetical protein
MTKLLIAIMVLPFLAGVVLAGQATLLSDIQMDQVTGNLPRNQFTNPAAPVSHKLSHVGPAARMRPHPRQLGHSKTSRSPMSAGFHRQQQQRPVR